MENKLGCAEERTRAFRGDRTRHAKRVSHHKTKSPLKWPGGKTVLAQRIIQALPPHTCYVEVFGGSLAVLLTKPRSKCEVINDINSTLVALYRVARWHPDELKREMALLINSREEMKAFREQPGLTDIQRAARFLFTNAISFGGDCRSFGVQRTGGGGAGSRLSVIAEKLISFHERLDGVAIENLPWQRCLDLYDSAETVFFLDPPYVEGAQKAYASWTPEQMQELRAKLDQIKGRWVLTTGASEAERAAFAGCKIEVVSRPRGIRTGRQFREFIITPQ